MLAEALETEPARRYRLFREEQAAERERIESERLETLYSCWTCACNPGCAHLGQAPERCADHGGPCREGEKQLLQAGKSDKNPAGATLIVMREIRRCFPDQADEIIQSLRWHGFDRMWSFVRWDHFVGVELDGHIHT